MGGWWLYSSSGDKHPPLHSALQPNKSLRCRLRQVDKVSHDTSRFRFDLPTPEHSLGLPVAGHILAHDGANVSRAYTPVTLDRFDKGYFDLLIKRYPGGEFSERFHRMRPGIDSMTFRGPVVTLQYEANVVKTLGMVCGGTGITPMYQVLRTALADPDDTTQLRLVFANRSTEDILLRAELEALAKEHAGRFQVRYLLEDEASLKHSGLGGMVLGRVDAAAVEGFLPKPDDPTAALLVCGPEGMMRFLCGNPSRPGSPPPPLGGLLGQLGYGTQVIQFASGTGLSE